MLKEEGQIQLARGHGETKVRISGVGVRGASDQPAGPEINGRTEEAAST